MAVIRHILAPVDFSDCSRAAVDYAFFLARTFGASLDVLHVWSAPAYVSPYVAVQVGSGAEQKTLEQVANEEAHKQMDQFLAGTPPPEGLELNVLVEFGGAAADVIVKAATGYDLVVVGTQGRSGLSYLLMGSVAEKVVRGSPCPVLVVRPKR